MIRRLKIRFICINMLIVTVMLAVIFGMVLHITSRNMEEQSSRILQSIHDAPGLRDPVMKERRVPHFVVRISPQGEVTLNADSFMGQGDNPELLRIAMEAMESGAEHGVLKEENLRFSRKKAPFGEELVFVDTSMERGLMEQLLKTCISISIVSYLLFFAISVLLAQWAIRPVESAWKNQRQFVADASHELKTPLTVITTNAELLQDPTVEPGIREQLTASVLAMSRQMRGLVEGLLELSRVDNGVVKTTFTELDLGELVSDCLLPFEPLFFEKGMELEADVEPGILLRGSEAHLRQMTDILLDNAAKYGLAQLPVQVCLQRQGHYAHLSVATAGDAISREDLKNIFKRFYRIDKARSMNQSYGLGLAIAEGIVNDHRGRIWAESKNGVNTFFVQLPVLPHRQET